MKKKIWSIICYSGIPWFFVFLIFGAFVKKDVFDKTANPSLAPPGFFEEYKYVLIVSVIACICIFLKNLLYYGTEKEVGLFTWLERYEYAPPKNSERKRKAQYPKVASEYLSDTPDGLVLGYYDNQYVRVPISKGNILNAIILGSAGCGKSVLLLTMLLYQLNKVPVSKEPMVFYCTDIKPELAAKSGRIWKPGVSDGNRQVRVMDPHKRDTFGWDVYYRISPSSDDDDIMHEMDIIWRAFVDCTNDKNEFFYNSARTIGKAILFFTFKRGYSFIAGMDYLTDGSLDVVISKTMEQIKDKPEFKIVYKLLSPYVSKTSEAMQDIELTLRESLAVFITDAAHYFLDGNPNKTSPEDLERKISIFFALGETRLLEYRAILRLCTLQVMDHLTGRGFNRHMITMVIDEAAKLGDLGWVDFLATSRQRAISTIFAFQDINQAYDKWGPEKTKSLLGLCRILEILSCTDSELARIISDWGGDYSEKRISMNNGNSNGGYSLSYEDKRIIQSSDISNIQDLKEALVFIKGKYFRVSTDNARYYNIPELNKISEECQRYNTEE